MKASATRRRSKAQILEDKASALAKEKDIAEKLDAWDFMMKQLDDNEEKQDKMRAKWKKIEHLFDNGYVRKDQQGQYEVVKDEAEAAHLREERAKRKRRKTMAEAELNATLVDTVQEQEEEEAME